MRSDNAPPVRLADYRPSDYLIDTVHLDIRLDGAATRVTARLALRPNPEGEPGRKLVLDGDDLTLVSATLGGVALDEGSYAADADSFTLHQPPQGPFELTLETALDPAANTQLMGLYRTQSCTCTQCEPEGFRRITYFLDRPDVLAVYTTRIEAPRQEAPVLLANGNRTDAGDLPGGRHFAVWHDPFPKPSYLFAMVAGALDHLADSFVTASGRKVALEIHVEPGKADRAAYAMDALKRSMRWDEQAFGREYDLDVFMIVAVSDFNMGAMENKGLNIFNDKYVLALPETATDQDYATIEAIIAHEYFHNWTGNRITCRDWFQLCLKEGLTVFRDQEFTSDQRSRPVKRIADVRALRSAQFVEDAGPLAHPVRPDVYSEINNFYTATVYEKGAEVVRMLKALIGERAFRAGMDLYFDRHDGEAVTIEDFIACFAESSRSDLAQFMLWYHQSGTPEVSAAGSWDEAARTFRLELTQSTPPTPGQPSKRPMVIPVRLGLVGTNGDLPVRLEGRPFDGLVALTQASQSFVFEDVAERPVASLLRGFSAPVKLTTDLDEDALLTLFRSDSDPFNRWQAAQTFATSLILKRVRNAAAPIDPRFLAAMDRFLDDAAADPAFAALTLTLPSGTDIAREIGVDVDPDAIFSAREALRQAIGDTLHERLMAARAALRVDGPYSPDAAAAGRRALRNGLLYLACGAGRTTSLDAATAQFAQADNMTDRFAALSILTQSDLARSEPALETFHDRYRGDALVIDKWLAVQAQIPDASTLDRVKRLMRHPAFSLGNPNRVRSLVGTFCNANPAQFNRADGEGFRFLADVVLDLDGRNPQVAARLMGALRSWRSLEAGRRALAGETLRRVAAQPRLSRDLADIVQRALA